MDDNQYTHIAEIYSHLMSSIDYSEWADYIYDIGLDFVEGDKKVLELGSGTCELSVEVLKYFNNTVASDISKQMLDNAMLKRLSRVCCDMTLLPFKKKFNYVFCAFDSVNYLLESEQIIKMYDQVASVLTDDGIFTFDVSLENNSFNNTKFLNREGDYKGIKYKQVSIYNEETRIHENHFEIVLRDGKKVEELHKQRIYPFFSFFELAEYSDLYVLDCFDSFSFEHASEESERAQFVMRKR
ncbi:MAG: class I SAM-dependent methyltransferase [Melioribacteraceae bacterium]|nr:class I SAM-dependent methyltransferase [Melioribacteraceae bacterium]